MLMTPTLCLVAAMYFEARNQTSDAMLGVGQVLMENTENGKTMYDTLKKKGLFSWAKYGVKIPKPKSPADVEVFQHQQKLARKMLFKQLRTPLLRGKYKHFNNWQLGRRFKTEVKLVRIGDLVFY
jgi:hypothetical protein